MTSKTPILIGFTGHFGSGKDTAIQAIQTYDSRAKRLAFATPLYDAIYQLNPIITWTWFLRPVRLQHLVAKHGWEYTKRRWPEVRRLLQRMGTEVGRELWGPQFWVNQLFAKWDPEVPTLIADVRFPEEFAAIRDRGGVVVRVKRADHKLETAHKHESEKHVDSAFCAATLINESIPEFQAAVVELYHDHVAYVTTDNKTREPLVNAFSTYSEDNNWPASPSLPASGDTEATSK